MDMKWVAGQPPDRTDSWDLRVYGYKFGFCVPNDEERGPLWFWFVGFRSGLTVWQREGYSDTFHDAQNEARTALEKLMQRNAGNLGQPIWR